MNKIRRRSYYRDPEFLLQVGARIRSLRLERNMRIDDLAFNCGVDNSQIQRMETGKVNFSISQLKLVAAQLSVDPKELLP